MERAAALSRHAVIDAADLTFLQAPPPADLPDETLPDAVTRLEKSLIRRALHAAGGNRADAARRLGIPRQALYDKLRRYELDVSEIPTHPVGKADI